MNSSIRSVAALAVAIVSFGTESMLAQSTERVSVSTPGTEGNGDSGWNATAITSDGRFVALTSTASTLVANGTNGAADVFVHDRQNGTTERVSLSTAGAQGNADSGNYGIAISTDGRFVAFGGNASNLIAGDSNGWADVFVRDRLNGTTERVSVATSVAPATSPAPR